jgi:hypothetical protein
MTSKKVQYLFFSSLFVISLLSSLYINGEAKELETQGYEVSYFSTEDAEKIFPDVRFVSHIVDAIKDVVFYH